MHPEICRFPSARFYDNKVRTGNGITAESNRIDCHKMPCFGPYVFLDVSFGSHARVSHGDCSSTEFGSLGNPVEANCVVALIHQLESRFPNMKSRSSELVEIGIITPYREQVRLIRNLVNKAKFKISVEVNTVDGFQGREKDIIIFSCVRAATNMGIGFLKDQRRLNVALTRAKSSVWIIGSAGALKQDRLWSDLIDDATQRNCFLRIGDNNHSDGKHDRSQKRQNVDDVIEEFVKSSEDGGSAASRSVEDILKDKARNLPKF
eukprot:TRINITY_DN1133_c0_g1_i1.p1 TRINITY_DN1133_c0_g1~~TRINITY_DN1133_c0_g1_i1.p1  ORF type:complete len:263 (-),score=85.64 TRINITY_DN1133_c0_g1_i1:76-864(-)